MGRHEHVSALQVRHRLAAAMPAYLPRVLPGRCEAPHARAAAGAAQRRNGGGTMTSAWVRDYTAQERRELAQRRRAAKRAWTEQNRAAIKLRAIRRAQGEG